ncbi:RuvX/YqgF family protein [Pseudothermotoga thermarum]|uniref:Holliday junction resolvase YqgF n=1 Tax=Pseudothermotoga thermarum DSM 5069 TaxID=688269 RepID=F7YVR0_9THEM|nr:RuvX/YqgF family protein [Pseudothermotoga thermarum]AEH51726.1 Holliday junction resolvase YqgF [Pseudothermotoga thermarum DSM 5069]
MIAAIDYGKARCGVAIGERIPSKVFTVPPEKIKEELSKYNLEAIVVGLPLSMSGRYSLQTFEVVGFAERLQKELNKKVYMIDERLTSELFKGKENVDELVAVQLFQEFTSSKITLYQIKPAKKLPEDILETIKIFQGKILLAEISDVNAAGNNTTIFQTDPYYAYLFHKAGFFVERSWKELEKLSPFDMIVVEGDCNKFKTFLSKGGKLVCL